MNTEDEYTYETSPEVAEKLKLMMEQAMVKAGAYLKLHIPLAGEGKIGRNWRDIH